MHNLIYVHFVCFLVTVWHENTYGMKLVDPKATDTEKTARKLLQTIIDSAASQSTEKSIRFYLGGGYLDLGKRQDVNLK